MQMLARQVRLLSTEQVGRFLLPDGNSKVQRRAGNLWAKRLWNRGIIERYRVTARTASFDGELLRYLPGDAAPDFKALSRALKARALLGTPRQVDVVRLSKAGAKAFQVPQARCARRSEGSHELRLAEAALSMRDMVTCWTSEDALMREKRFRGVVPDALVAFHGAWHGGGSFALECGGSYSAASLQHFHEALLPSMEGATIHGYIIV
jgi:hypothetical protein